jgi:ubiquinone/menaquinone biosynthesis C-methylase UbiE
MVRYARLSRQMWTSPVSRAIVDLLEIAPGDRALDIGAGMGAGTMVAARAGADVVAVEPTPFLRRVLRMRRLGQRARRRISVVDGAAEHLAVPDGSIDAAWASNVMHHWTDAEQAVAELARALRAGGRLLLVDEDFDDPTHPAHEEISARRANRPWHFDEVDPADIGAKLAAAGFTVDLAGKGEIAGRPAKVVRATRF